MSKKFLKMKSEIASFIDEGKLLNRLTPENLNVFFFSHLQIDITRAVKKFSGSILIMNSRQNLHQRHKFLRAEATRDILKIRV